MATVIVTGVQPFVTNALVAKGEKSEQWHFYVPPTLRESCERVFEEQGVKASEGLKRLVQTLVDAPEDVRILLLRQASGEAAVALASHVIARAAEEQLPPVITRNGKLITPLEPSPARKAGAGKRPGPSPTR